jgi:hypothetical protein
MAQDSGNIRGAGIGERESSRLDERLSSAEEKGGRDRVLEQRLGWEEKGIREEAREAREESERTEELARMERARLERAQEVAAKRARLAEQEFEKKKKFQSTLAGQE